MQATPLPLLPLLPHVTAATASMSSAQGPSCARAGAKEVAGVGTCLSAPPAGPPDVPPVVAVRGPVVRPHHMRPTHTASPTPNSRNAWVAHQPAPNSTHGWGAAQIPCTHARTHPQAWVQDLGPLKRPLACSGTCLGHAEPTTAATGTRPRGAGLQQPLPLPARHLARSQLNLLPLRRRLCGGQPCTLQLQAALLLLLLLLLLQPGASSGDLQLRATTLQRTIAGSGVGHLRGGAPVQ